MFTLVAVASSLSASHSKAEARATATVRIERTARASRQEWDQSPNSERRQKIVRDENGNIVVLRLIEHE
jgi:hypothetical protein